MLVSSVFAESLSRSHKLKTSSIHDMLLPKGRSFFGTFYSMVEVNPSVTIFPVGVLKMPPESGRVFFLSYRSAVPAVVTMTVELGLYSTTDTVTNINRVYYLHNNNRSSSEDPLTETYIPTGSFSMPSSYTLLGANFMTTGIESTREVNFVLNPAEAYILAFANKGSTGYGLLVRTEVSVGEMNLVDLEYILK